MGRVGVRVLGGWDGGYNGLVFLLLVEVIGRGFKERGGYSW